MEFNYEPFEASWGAGYKPTIPITFSYKKKGISIGHALVDTGADMTLLPLDVAEYLKIEVDIDNGLPVAAADGKKFFAYPSIPKIEYRIACKGFPSYFWKGHVYFTEARVVLLGHHDCLERFYVLFKGPERGLKITLRP